MTTDPAHRTRTRPFTRVIRFATGLSATVALALTPFMQPPSAHAWDHDYYEFCTTNLGQPSPVCCSNAGGNWSDDGDCTSAAAVPAPMPAVTQQVLPPVAVAPAR